MKSKNISSQSGQLLGYFNGLGKNAFSYQEALKGLPKSNDIAVRKLLSDMTRRGLLLRLKEGVYYIIPYEADAETFMPDWHLIAEHLVKDPKHYIGFYSALQIHNLITQPSLTEQVVVARQVFPSVIKVKDVSFQFIYMNPKHFFGAKKVWIDSFHKVACSDLEKTIIDCLFRPDYAGGIVETAKAIFASKANLDFKRLLQYAEKFGSQAVVKRLGYLLELLAIDTPVVKELKKMKSLSYTPLDTELKKGGKLVSRWSIQQNIEPETILSAIYT